MKIVLAASEGVPFCKTGGLADVVGALSHALAKKGQAVRVFLPLYKQIDRAAFRLRDTKKKIDVRLFDRPETCEIWERNETANLKFYFIRCDRYFAREGLYGFAPGVDFIDNAERFILFSRAVLEAAKALNFRPDIIHAHDWQTGLMAPYLKTVYSSDPFYAKTASVFTVHNMAYQGLFPRSLFPATGLPSSEFRPDRIEFYGQVNFLKAGLVYSDSLTTVSPTYARETQSDSHFGCGLEGVLKDEKDHYHGILNGIDMNYWNPGRDLFIAARYTKATVKKRDVCKAALQKELGLRVDNKAPLLSFIGRLDSQKGLDILTDTVPYVLKKGAQLIVLGVGDDRFRSLLRDLQAKAPTQVRLEDEFAEPLAHRIYAGADIFLMPSRYEPCGLGQMIAMRYGSIPIVTPTGGLLDTVVDANESLQGTGFVAATKTPIAYLAALQGALRLWENRAKWDALQRRAMSVDFSWAVSVEKYVTTYLEALERRLVTHA